MTPPRPSSLRSKLGSIRRRLFPPHSRLDGVVLPAPDREIGRVVFTGFGRGRYSGSGGKVTPQTFFPPFCEVLARHGFRSYFVDTPAALARVVRDNTAIVHIYREVSEDLTRFDLRKPHARAKLVFNDPPMGRILADKAETNRLYGRHGIPIPAMVDSSEGPTFSNAIKDSGAEVRVLGAGEPLDPARYNTRFIDTRLAYEGQEYYTSVRLFSVGTRLLHSFARARLTTDGSASVHAVDMPLDPGLIEDLQRRLVAPNLARFTDLAARIGEVLGPGFYAHDLLIERETSAIFVCETGFKFNDMGATNYLSPIAPQLPSQRIMFSEELARRSAEAFLAECGRLGMRLLEP